ncbi:MULTISPECIES: DUF2795 domain-containing protein [Actinomadura]|uniref:DUF2795 domain-containing protein n=1 Tax=Actinomadura miaoliensis TaxID=430685 RepID=A0ABP7WI15_9ACTN
MPEGDKTGKHGPKLDDEMGHETEGMVRGGGPTHAEEWRQPEPVSDDLGHDPTSRGTSVPPGSPPGMDPEDVQARSAVAQSLLGVRYPASRSELIDHAAAGHATDAIMSMLERLPDREYENMADVGEALGLGRERHRF